MLHGSENRIVEDARAVTKGLNVDLHGTQNAQVNIGHLRVAIAPIGSVTKSHIRATGNQRWQILGVMGGARAAAVQHNRVV